MTLWYLATPYSKYPDGIEAAFNLALDNMGLLIQAGIPVYSPIAHSHPIAMRCNIDPFDHSIWMPVDQPMINACTGIIMLMADSWEFSYGMNYELKDFQSKNKPVVWMHSGEIPHMNALNCRT